MYECNFLPFPIQSSNELEWHLLQEAFSGILGGNLLLCDVATLCMRCFAASSTPLPYYCANCCCSHGLGGSELQDTFILSLCLSLGMMLWTWEPFNKAHGTDFFK